MRRDEADWNTSATYKGICVALILLKETTLLDFFKWRARGFMERAEALNQMHDRNCVARLLERLLKAEHGTENACLRFKDGRLRYEKEGVPVHEGAHTWRVHILAAELRDTVNGFGHREACIGMLLELGQVVFMTFGWSSNNRFNRDLVVRAVLAPRQFYAGHVTQADTCGVLYVKMLPYSKEVYVGETEKSPVERWLGHVSAAEGTGSRVYSRRKYFSDFITIHIVTGMEVPRRIRLEVEDVSIPHFKATLNTQKPAMCRAVRTWVITPSESTLKNNWREIKAKAKVSGIFYGNSKFTIGMVKMDRADKFAAYTNQVKSILRGADSRVQIRITRAMIKAREDVPRSISGIIREPDPRYIYQLRRRAAQVLCGEEHTKFQQNLQLIAKDNCCQFILHRIPIPFLDHSITNSVKKLIGRYVPGQVVTEVVDHSFETMGRKIINRLPADKMVCRCKEVYGGFPALNNPMHRVVDDIDGRKHILVYASGLSKNFNAKARLLPTRNEAAKILAEQVVILRISNEKRHNSIRAKKIPKMVVERWIDENRAMYMQIYGMSRALVNLRGETSKTWDQLNAEGSGIATISKISRLLYCDVVDKEKSDITCTCPMIVSEIAEKFVTSDEYSILYNAWEQNLAAQVGFETFWDRWTTKENNVRVERHRTPALRMVIKKKFYKKRRQRIKDEIQEKVGNGVKEVPTVKDTRDIIERAAGCTPPSFTAVKCRPIIDGSIHGRARLIKAVARGWASQLEVRSDELGTVNAIQKFVTNLDNFNSGIDVQLRHQAQTGALPIGKTTVHTADLASFFSTRHTGGMRKLR